MATTTPAVLLVSDDLADLLNCSLRTLHRLNASGKLPAPIRIGTRGARPRWRREEIEAWIVAGCPPRTEWEARKEITLAHGSARTRR
jgi:predicted DNA-binding transcriptional regulator AlpA